MNAPLKYSACCIHTRLSTFIKKFLWFFLRILVYYFILFFSVLFSEDLSGFNILHDLRSRCSALGMGGKKRKLFEVVVQSLQKIEQYFIFLGFFFLVIICLRLAILNHTFYSVAPYFSDIISTISPRLHQEMLYGHYWRGKVKINHVTSVGLLRYLSLPSALVFLHLCCERRR